MPDFAFQDLFPSHEDPTVYRKLSSSGLSVGTYRGKRILEVDGEVLRSLTATAIRDISHLLRPTHLAQLRAIFDDPLASGNDRFVARQLLRNAVTAAEMVLPSCQDTGTAIVLGKRGQQVWTDGEDERWISRGIFDTFTGTNLRYSQLAPLTMYEEKNTGSNLPAQIDLHSVPGDAYRFLFMTKGGGSANKTYLFQETKALLNPNSLTAFLNAKIRGLGTSACPPYHLAIVIGGLSAEQTLKTVKLASARYLDDLPTAGGPGGHAFRDLALEAEVLEMTREMGIGAQFGGRYFCHDIRVIRLPRHGASCPVGLGVSCSADRQARAKITADGVFLEQLETDPGRFLPEPTPEELGGEVVRIDLDRPMAEIRATLSQHPIKTRLSLTGTLVVARDIAHARLLERLQRGEPLPDYFRDKAVYYAGPAKTPAGMPSGSFGPTTAGRMDSYLDPFMAAGGSFVTLAKGNRSQAVTDACKRYGGFYLGSIGGPAAILAAESIQEVSVLDMPELGLGACWQIRGRDFPAFVVVDDKGNDFFA